MTPNPRLGDQGLEIDMHANVPYHALKALAAIAPTEELRWYLKGVHIEAKKDYTILVVTNGNYLVAHKHPLTKGEPDQDEFDCILPVQFLRSIKVAKRELKYRSDIVLTLEDIPEKMKETPQVRRAALNLPNGTSMITETLDGRYPDWRKIMPTTFSDQPSQFDPNYVADVYRAIAGCYDKQTVWPPLRHNGADKVGGVVYSDTVGLIMPRRTMDDKQCMPDWAMPAGWNAQPSNVHKIAA